jgi:AhpC/TSA family
MKSTIIFLLVLLAVQVGSAEHLLRSIDGTVLGSLENPKGWTWTLLFFVMSDCPIANQYAPEVQRVCTAYGPKGVRCFLVYVDPAMKTADIRKHMKDFNYTSWPAILDSGHGLVEKAGATIVSEVAVFSNNGELKYRGRIDDRYSALGKPRQVVTKRDLVNALDALVANRNVTNPRTEAFGCFIPPK